jgi:hypothetical protein
VLVACRPLDLATRLDQRPFRFTRWAHVSQTRAQ